MGTLYMHSTELFTERGVSEHSVVMRMQSIPELRKSVAAETECRPELFAPPMSGLIMLA